MSDDQTTHELKCWHGPFADVCEGRKLFEIRRTDDRTFGVGDVLYLREWSEAGGYTGRSVTTGPLTCVYAGGQWLPDGLAVLGFARLAERRP